MASIDSVRWLRASGYLDRALETPLHEREAYLAALRAEDPEAADDIAALLDEHRLLAAEGFLEAGLPVEPPIDSRLAGVTIGAYTLSTRIGHGGMGSVWLATRSDGRFEGQAALKLLNAAFVGRGGEARFKREGTILARLTHPHIARLIDAGVSNTGQPYLVLEHIDGRHIDSYCDEEHLTIEARIRLFLDVTAAVAHAHANLIVHRDLKPSNVLVTTAGQVKLLDFGIAKLIEDDTTQRAATMITREASSVLTPKYAAPEQVSNGVITTATDVYSLGVLLYELLSGQHPTGRGAKSSVDFAKTVVESEPLRLSAAVGSAIAPDEAVAVAARRSTTPDRLRRQLRGDLETILSKALKKNPAERYVSVTAFADDLRRYVTHEPIAARPDTVRYRATKFVRRHRHGVAGTIGVSGLLMALVAFYTAQLAAERDRAQLEAAKASRVSELLTGLLTGADPYRDPDTEPTVRNLLDRGADRARQELGDQPEVQAEMLTVIGRTFERMGLPDRALPLLEQALAIGRKSLGPDSVRTAQTLNSLGVLQRERGNLAAAEPLLAESLAMRRRLLGSEDKDVAVTLVELARVLEDAGRYKEAEPLAREALAIRRKIFGEEHRETATSKAEVGLILRELGDLDTAAQLFRENLDTNERLLGEGHPNTSAAKNQLALVLRDKGDHASAEPLFRQALAVDRRTLGDAHHATALRLNNLAVSVEALGRLDEAQTMYDEVLRITSSMSDEHPRKLIFLTNHARLQIKRGNAAAAEPSLRRILAVRQRIYPPTDWHIGQTQSLLAAALVAEQRDAEAEPLMRAADTTLKPIPGMQQWEKEDNRARLVALYTKTGRAAEANVFK
jgi:serine/threonine protein kinase/tetratricopeptide (TPR) repeat protein